MDERFDGLAPEFRPGGSKDPKWMQGVRSLLADGAASVEPQIVVDLFAYYDAAKGHGTRPSFLERLEVMWAETASLISHHHADDSTKEWGHANNLRPLLLELERQIKSYSGPRPDGKNYLLGADFRIDWPTTPETGA
jgi:hypothetical protein